MKVSILMPCYNGGSVLKRNIPKLFDYVSLHKEHQFNIVVVNDGSKDNTLEILKKIKGITLFSYDKNRGKGGAIQYGIQHIKPCDAIVIMDADFSFGLDAIGDSVKELKNNDVVIGSRFIKGSYSPVKRPLKRRIASKCCNIIVNVMFRFNIKDTQCGFKCFKYASAIVCANNQVIYDWAFDVEYLYIAKLNNYKIKEIPVICVENNNSTVKIVKASVNFLKSLLKIKRKH